MIIPGQILKLTPESRQILQTELPSITQDLEDENAPYFNKIKHWMDYYEAVPRHEKKDFPFTGASNVVIPLIKIMSDALQARTLGSIFGAGEKIWTFTSENEDPLHTKVISNMARYQNWQARGNTFNFFLNCFDWTGELYPIGESVIALNYAIDRRPVFFGPTSNDPAKLKATMVEFNRGPQFEHVMRHLILWDTMYNIQDAPVVIREHSYSWAELSAMAQTDPAWDREALEEIRSLSKPSYSSSASSEVQAKMDSHDDREPGFGTKRLDIREAWIDWSVLRNLKIQPPGKADLTTPQLPTVVHFERNSGTVLRFTAQPYHLPAKPFYCGFFRKRSGRAHSIGVAKNLYHLQSGITTMYNQTIDASTRSNAIWAVTTDPGLAMKALDPRHPLIVPSMESWREMKLPVSVQPEMAMSVGLHTYAERLIGVNDPAVGRETRHGGHPSPATSTLALLEQTGVMQQPSGMMLRAEISRMGRDVAILNQQFGDSDDKLRAVFGEQDTEALNLFMSSPIPSLYQCEVTAMSDKLNPEAEMNRATRIAQINQLYWGQVMQAVQMIEHPKVGPLLKQTAIKSITSTTNVYSKFLDAGNVDDMEKFILELEKLGPDNASALQNFAGGVREVGEGAGAVSNGQPNGAANGGVPPGGAGPSAGIGAGLQ